MEYVDTLKALRDFVDAVTIRYDILEASWLLHIHRRLMEPPLPHYSSRKTRYTSTTHERLVDVSLAAQVLSSCASESHGRLAGQWVDLTIQTNLRVMAARQDEHTSENN